MRFVLGVFVRGEMESASDLESYALDLLFGCKGYLLLVEYFLAQALCARCGFFFSGGVAD